MNALQFSGYGVFVWKEEQPLTPGSSAAPPRSQGHVNRTGASKATNNKVASRHKVKLTKGNAASGFLPAAAQGYGQSGESCGQVTVHEACQSPAGREDLQGLPSRTRQDSCSLQRGPGCSAMPGSASHRPGGTLAWFWSMQGSSV